MKILLSMIALIFVAFPAVSAEAGVSISVGQPGFYGRIDIADAPPPQLVYMEPVIIQQINVQREPIYLHVPPGDEKNWRKRCRKYNACGQRVYFVQDNWYNDVYVPHHQRNHGHGNKDDRKRDKDNGHGKGTRND